MSDHEDEIWEAESWEETDPTAPMHALDPTEIIPQQAPHQIEYKSGAVDKPIKSRESHALKFAIGTVVASAVVCTLLIMSQHGDRIPTPQVTTETTEGGHCRYPDMMHIASQTRKLQEYLSSHTIQYGDNAGQPYYTGPIDGDYGDVTRRSVTLMQADMAKNNIYPDNLVDGDAMEETCKAMGEDFYDTGN